MNINKIKKIPITCFQEKNMMNKEYCKHNDKDTLFEDYIIIKSLIYSEKLTERERIALERLFKKVEDI